jgi:hypothetical protein
MHALTFGGRAKRTGTADDPISPTTFLCSGSDAVLSETGLGIDIADEAR